uniref:Regulatory protein zeste n=1 Tax=Angiostrongylus cantonensis TaxID=6313 RepID=A0A158P9P6_ANGCA
MVLMKRSSPWMTGHDINLKRFRYISDPTLPEITERSFDVKEESTSNDNEHDEVKYCSNTKIVITGLDDDGDMTLARLRCLGIEMNNANFSIEEEEKPVSRMLSNSQKEKELRRERGEMLVKLFREHPRLAESATARKAEKNLERAQMWEKITCEVNDTFGSRLEILSVEKVKKLLSYYKRDDGICDSMSAQVNAERHNMWLKIAKLTNDKYMGLLNPLGLEQTKKLFSNCKSRRRLRFEKKDDDVLVASNLSASLSTSSEEISVGQNNNCTDVSPDAYLTSTNVFSCEQPKSMEHGRDTNFELGELHRQLADREAEMEHLRRRVVEEAAGKQQTFLPYPEVKEPSPSAKRRRAAELAKDKKAKIASGFYQPKSDQDDTLEQIVSLQKEESEKKGASSALKLTENVKDGDSKQKPK